VPDPRLYPALEIIWREAPDPDAVDRLLADLDTFSPTAVEDLQSGIRVFFCNDVDRDRARDSLADARANVVIEAIAVSDEAWAERSQAALGSVRVGRIVVAPPWATVPDAPEITEALIIIRIQPSMGFGTGHHASTRLCLQLLQDVPLSGQSMLDVGTGSAVLAIAASRLGAATVLAIDVDEDALTSARENAELNGAALTIQLGDVLAQPLDHVARFHTITANLTGALLQRAASALSSLVIPDGVLIASGFQDDELEPVTGSLETAGFVLEERAHEEQWVGLRLRRRPATG
jgi:ribosomal protein L11 methyltransferase